MTYRPDRLAALAAAAAVTLSSALSAQPADLGALLAKLTWADPAEGRATVAEILRGGAPAIQGVIDQLKPPGGGDDAAPRFAIEGLILAVTAGGDEAGRQTVSSTLAAALQTQPDADVRAYLISVLQRVGRDEAVHALAACLTDVRLGPPAAMALVRIGTPAAAAALRQAWNTAAEGARPTLAQAMGEVQDPAAVPLLLPLLTAADKGLRQAAMLAVADLGAAEAAGPLLTLAQGADVGEARLARSALVRLIRRLHASGRTAEAETVCARLGEVPGAAEAALSAWVDLRGAAAMPVLLHAVAAGDPLVRASALELALELPGAEITQAWCAAAAGAAAPDVRGAVLAMLGQRRDALALPTLHRALGDADDAVRRAAIEALARCGGADAVPRLIAIAAGGPANDVEAAAGVLAWLDAPDFALAVARALPTATPLGKQALAALLAARRATAQADAVLALLEDADEGVRRDALKSLETILPTSALPRVAAFLLGTDSAADRRNAQRVVVAACRRDAAGIQTVLQALAATPGAARVPLLQTLSSIGGAEALAVVVADVRGDDAAVREAAMRVLADWPDAAAAEPLLQVVAEAGNDTVRTLALRGYVRVVTLPADRPPAATAAMLERAWTAAAGDADRRLVLGGLGSVRHDSALRLPVAAMAEAALRDEAAAAIVGICCPPDDKSEGLRTPAARDAVALVSESGAPKGLVDKAKEHLARIPPVGANLALGRPVTTSMRHEADKLPERAVNGVLTREDGWWGAGTPAWIQVDLGKPSRIDAVRALFYWDGTRYYQYTVSGSADGEAWQVLADASGNTTPSTSLGHVHRFNPLEVRHVRLEIRRNSANPSCHLTELEVYAEGQSPQQFPVAEPPAPPKPEPIVAPPLPEPDAEGFIPLFNGTDLAGWMGSTAGYAVEDGTLVCLEKGGGTLLTMHRFSDFVLRFEFDLPKGANNGLAIRTPAKGNAAYAGMELQIIDNEGYKEVHNYDLKPWQVHGSIYGCVPAERVPLRPPGTWNEQEVRAVGGQITVILNGRTILDANVDDLTETADGKGIDGHPGLQRRTGHIGWLGHGARVAFRNIRIQPLEPYVQGPHNVPPEGFAALFNGVDLAGWKGLLKAPNDNPEKRAALTPEQLRELQAEADANMRANWTVEDGALVFSGKGRSLCTAKDYGDFEMYVDWKIKPLGDSGVYLRGSPQVQIWDPAKWPQGSGGLYNNQKNPRDPSECADNPIGQWNRFFIRMVGEKVSVTLNGVKVVEDVIMENYWDRSKPIYPTGQIELQNHGNTLWFRSIYLRELAP